MIFKTKKKTQQNESQTIRVALHPQGSGSLQPSFYFHFQFILFNFV